MKVILIDPFRKVVEAVELKDGEYESLKTAVFGKNIEALDRELLEHVSLGAGHGAYLDEEGLLKPWDLQAFFRLGPTQIFAGRTVIVRDTDDGDVSDATLPISAISAKVTWVEPRDVRVPAPTVQSLPDEWKPGDPLPEAVVKEWWTYDNQPN